MSPTCKPPPPFLVVQPSSPIRNAPKKARVKAALNSLTSKTEKQTCSVTWTSPSKITRITAMARLTLNAFIASALPSSFKKKEIPFSFLPMDLPTSPLLPNDKAYRLMVPTPATSPPNLLAKPE
ncbi:hypothetical protein FKM82_019085 [Ascaphus truei]